MGRSILRFNNFIYAGSFNQWNSGFPAKTGVTSMFNDSKGNLWIGGTGDIVRQKDSFNWTTFPGNGGDVSQIAEDKNGVLWFATGNGLLKYDGVNWTNYNRLNSNLTSNQVVTIAIDKQDNKWLGTIGGGVFKFNNSQWQQYSLIEKGLNSNDVLSINIDSNGHKWFGGLGGAAKFDDVNWESFNKINGVPNNTVWDINIDKNGNVWFAVNKTETLSGLVQFNGKHWLSYKIKNGLPFGDVSKIVTNNSNRTFVMSRTEGGNGALYEIFY